MEPNFIPKTSVPVNSDKSLHIMSPRIELLYHFLQDRMTRKQRTWGGDITILDDPEITSLPYVLRKAKAFEKTLAEMPITIEENDLIVGNTTFDNDIVRTTLPLYATPQELEYAEKGEHLIDVGLAHKTPYYPQILDQGLSGILKDINEKIADLEQRPLNPENNEKLSLFKAMYIECKAVMTLSDRYTALAKSLAKQAPPQRRNELLQIAAICHRVPRLPASSFQEAVQSFWFIHYALFSTQTVISCGRLDQFLYPFLKNDLENGIITVQKAQEIIDCLWLRFNDRLQIIRENFFKCSEPSEKLHRNVQGRVYGTNQVMKAGHRDRVLFAEEQADAINHFGQNILLSGIRPDGTDGTNELTYLCLNALEKFTLLSPVVTVRLHKDSPTNLFFRTAEVLRKGGGQPFLNNDDVLIQAYVNLGVPLEDARDYANSNCWETMIQGKSDQELIRGINFLLYLELVLNRGVSQISGKQLGIDTGDPKLFQQFSDLLDAWKQQLDYQLKQAIEHIGRGILNSTLEHSGHGKYCYNPFLSALTLDCIEKEKDVTRGGARYTIWHIMAEALANATDSLVAIKKMIFDDNTITMTELLKSLGDNWDASTLLRQRLISKLPKFSQDNDYADNLGQEMMDHFINRSNYHAQRYPMFIFPKGAGTFSWIKMSGGEVGATPDGRYSGEVVAANLSPAPSTDLFGPTAAIRSYLKMRVADLAAGAPIDLRISKRSLKGSEGLKRLAGFIQTFIDLGGNMLTITVTDVEELKRAMDEPEKYRHLRVRMGGWTAYFVMLSKEQQLVHIQRVEHGII
jgi:formate C-acetyltransferase